MKRFFKQFKFLELFSEKVALALIGAATLTAVLLNLKFNLIESNLYDLRMSRGFQPKADPSIVLVTIDNATTTHLNEFSPLPLNQHVKFLETIEQFEPKAIGYLVDLNRVEQNSPDPKQNLWREKFVSIANKIEQKGIPFVIGTPFDVTGEVLPHYPLSTLSHAVSVIHKDGNVFSEDKVTRRALTSLYGKPVFHVELATKAHLLSKDAKIRGSYYVREVDTRYFFFRYHSSPELKPNGELPYKRISFSTILANPQSAKEFLKDKIILVGTMTQEDSSDYAFTPYKKDPFLNPKIAIHANILDSVIHNSGIVQAPAWLNWIFTFATSAFVLWWVLTSTPLYGLCATLCLVLAFMIFGQTLFAFKGFWIRESQPLISIFLSYYLVVPYRLIREYKKRWDYQKKHELLVQVEELKTNFLNLVTHDLKTPVARIQGLVEVLQRQASERLNNRDQEHLLHMLNSTEELNRFITMLLELNKVESNLLQLELESKDINNIVEQTVQRYQATASLTQIKITTHLETLFPIKFDVSLISKVLSNLVDNAIKYSNPNTEITISTREIGSWIEITIQDQGMGLSSVDLDNIFTRFYRSKTASNRGVAGTGLGLYLTKFFIEAHQGEVIVQSKLGTGSTFTIRLPILISNSGLKLVLNKKDKLNSKIISKEEKYV